MDCVVIWISSTVLKQIKMQPQRSWTVKHLTSKLKNFLSLVNRVVFITVKISWVTLTYLLIISSESKHCHTCLWLNSSRKSGLIFSVHLSDFSWDSSASAFSKSVPEKHMLGSPLTFNIRQVYLLVRPSSLHSPALMRIKSDMLCWLEEHHCPPASSYLTPGDLRFS